MSHMTHSSSAALDIDTLEREGTAEMVNDPRFFTENVIDKRLAAFEAVAIVTEIMAAEAVKQCFEISKDFSFVGPLWFVGVIQLSGFLIMVAVMFMDLVAASVLSLQLFFTIRLMTAGPTGFDKAARFYSDNRMWSWRERAIFCVKWSIVGFMLSTGFMLFTTFYMEGAPQEEKEYWEKHKRAHAHEYNFHKSLAFSVLAIFVVLTMLLAWLMKQHQRVFDECYFTVDTCVMDNLHSRLMPAVTSNLPKKESGAANSFADFRTRLGGLF